MNLRNAIVVILLTAICNCCSANGPENSVVVVNAESATSKLVANFYIDKRKIPAQNVIYLSGIPNQETITLKDFQQKILIPVLTFANEKKLSDHLDCVIYSSDFPTIIDAKRLRSKPLNNGNSQRASNKILNPQISINSATYFFQKTLANDPGFLSLRANNYMRAEGIKLLGNPFLGEDSRLFTKALSNTRNDKFDEAIEIWKQLAEKHPLQLAVLYWMARTYAWHEDADKAAEWLARSTTAGWCYRDYTKSDTAFQKIMDDKKFRAVVDLIPDLPFRHGPTVGFRSAFSWGLNGMVNSTQDQGERYLLSTVLAVNRNRGNSEKETLDYLQTSIAADGTQPRGTFYFTKTGDVRTKTRFKGIDETIEELQKMGHRCEIETNRTPLGRDDIIGCSIGAPRFNWKNAKNRIMPGAICENLTSYGGRFMPTNRQTPLSHFLRYGAAGSSGTVIEPYAIQAKFPHPRIHVHYARGCTLAESFYQSVAGPFQLLIVGDPLCKPWAKIPKVTLKGDILSAGSVSGKMNFELGASSKPTVLVIEMYLNGRLARRIPRPGFGNIIVDTTTVPDGYHEFRFVGVASGTVGTRGRVIAPVMVNNNNQQVSLTAKSVAAEIGNTFEFSIKGKGASDLLLSHNDRVLWRGKGESAEFSLPAHLFGRGKVRVQAIGRFEDQSVRSRPMEIEIRGPISNYVPELKVITPPKKKKPAAKAAKPADKK